MGKRNRTTSRSADDSMRSPRRQNRFGIVQTSVYLPTAMHDALRAAAFEERCKIHDIMLEGIGLALKKRERRVGS
jgi:hypothetical protein